MIKNIKVGLVLMLASISSMLIVGNIRLGIEKIWGVETFGKVSFTLTLTSFVMIFISSLGIVIFPLLKKVNEERLPHLYLSIKSLVMPILSGMLLLYVPIGFFLQYWLPEYSDSIEFMAILFPVVIFEGKMVLLINTYLKALRKERKMFLINFSMVLVSLVMTFGIVLIMENLNLSVLLIVILLGTKCIIAELYLAKVLKISIAMDLFFEILLTFVFICSYWFFDTVTAMSVYFFVYIMYVLIKYSDIKKAVAFIKFAK